MSQVSYNQKKNNNRNSQPRNVVQSIANWLGLILIILISGNLKIILPSRCRPEVKEKKKSHIYRFNVTLHTFMLSLFICMMLKMA